MRVAVGQMTVDKDASVNTESVRDLAHRAAEGGARLLVLPEGIIARDPEDNAYAATHAEPVDGPFATALATASRDAGIAIACSIHVTVEGHVENVFVLHDRGQLLASYTKLHPYDAFSGQESASVTPGTELPPVVELDGLRLAPLICYDIRFPDLAVALALAGAEVLLCPAAWVKGPLKEHHWTTLVTARALDATAYVVGCGEISARNVGRSLVVDPLGVTIAAAAEEPCLFFADLDPARVSHARQVLPVLANRRLARPTL